MIAMAMKSYQSHAELLVKEYLLADPLIPYTSIIGGIFACKMVCFSLSYKKKKNVLLFFASVFSSYFCWLLVRYMILPTCSVLFTLRAIPASRNRNVLNGTTGD
jgi:hypothetical protein